MAATRKKKEKTMTVSGNLSPMEMKLLRLALDKGAYEGESDTAAIMFIRKLRERNVTADELFGNAQRDNQQTWVTKHNNGGNKKMTFGKYRNETIKNVPTDYLIWVLYNCANIDAELKLAIHQFLAEI